MTIDKFTEAVVLAQSAIDSAIGFITDEKPLLIAAKCRALIIGYNARWRNAGYLPLTIEQIVKAPLVNPDTNYSSHTFTTAGKIDLITEYNTRRILFDHKTTSQDISDPNGPYWRQLVVESQPSHYMLLEWLNGRKCDGAVWDVLRKPMISPKKLGKAEIAQAVASRHYCNAALSQASLDNLQVNDRETIEMYEARLAHDCTKERPDWYFQRRAVPRLDCEILDYAKDLWEQGQEILHARNTGRHARNSGACMLYSSPCKFLGICSGHDSSDSNRWQHKQQVHVELPELEGDGRDVLTNSRIRCFQTCRQKHYLSYELGIERMEEEEKESLFFGRLWHTALSAWWSCFLTKEPEHGNSNSESPAIAVGNSSSQATFVG
jgi:hypothetical protein